MPENIAIPDYAVTGPGFSIADAPHRPPEDAPGKKACKAALKKHVEKIESEQRKLFAANSHSMLLVFQAMDAAGKDSTIRSVFSGVNPAGFQESSFKRPSENELDHDFLWRTVKKLPERGRIGIFNRSYYEEVLIVRIHQAILAGQRIPNADPDDPQLWEGRLASIRDHEAHLARNGTHVIKFFLNVSRDEQKARFLDRLDTPRKNWKFELHDVSERGHWPRYMQAYEDAINATAAPHAPWYVVPADDKPWMRMTVANIVLRHLRSLELEYPEVDAAVLSKFDAMRDKLLSEDVDD